MKRSCFGCKAFDSVGDHRKMCSLNYQFELIYNPKTGHLIKAKPLEECPKPLTTKQLIIEINKKNKQL